MKLEYIVTRSEDIVIIFPFSKSEICVVVVVDILDRN